MKQTGQYVPLRCLLPSIDKDGRQIKNLEGCMLFTWNGVHYYERDENSLTFSDYGQEWDVMLCMNPADELL
jgi:hypothetical protein